MEPSTAASAVVALLGGGRSSRGGGGGGRAVDRTLGAAATLGLSIALLRLVAGLLRQQQHPLPPPASTRERRMEGREGCGDSADDEGRDIPSSNPPLPAFLYSLLSVVMRGLLLGGATKREADGGDVEDREGDTYFQAVYNRWTGDDGDLGDEEAGGTAEYDGSCHCGSVHFTLVAPRDLHALDGPGKIRYPHIPTSAENFQLTRGTRHLQMYYITPSSGGDGVLAAADAGDSDEAVAEAATAAVAAHAFCSRCGVHILRAPDRRSDALEVNANCLDRGSGGIGSGDDARRRMRVSFRPSEDRLSGMPSGGLSMAATSEDGVVGSSASFGDIDHRDDDAMMGGGRRIRSDGPLHRADGPQLSWSTAPSFAPTPPGDDFQKDTSSSSLYMPGTPSTSATSGSVSCDDVVPLPRSFLSDHESSSIGSSEDSSSGVVMGESGASSGLSLSSSSSVVQPAPVLSPGFGTGGGGAGVGSWSVGSSPHSLHPTPPAKGRTDATSSTSIAGDKLKYYMRRHLSSPRSNQEKGGP